MVGGALQRDRLGRRVVRRVAAVARAQRPALLRRTLLMLLSASLLANELREYNAEVFSATLVTLGIICIVTGQHTLLGWTGIVIAVVNTPASSSAWSRWLPQRRKPSRPHSISAATSTTTPTINAGVLATASTIPSNRAACAGRSRCRASRERRASRRTPPRRSRGADAQAATPKGA